MQLLYPLLNPLADGSPTARQLLEAHLDTLPPPQRERLHTQLLRFQPIEQHPPLDRASKAGRRFLIGIYRRQASTNPQALERLLLAAQETAKDAAVAASRDLERVSNAQLEPDRVLPLLRSRFAGVRVNALSAIAALATAGRPLSAQGLSTLCQHLQQERNQAPLRWLCDLVAQWVRQHQQVPPAVLPTLDGIPARLAEQGLFDGGAARSFLAALKVIAQSEDPCLDGERLGQQVHQLLAHIHIIQIDNSEAELIDLLCAMHRLRADFLAETVARDFDDWLQRGWLRNAIATIEAIRKLEGARSPLCDRISQRYDQISEIESAILDAKTG